MATSAPAESEQLRRKEAVIAEIREKLEASDAAVLTEYRGLTVSELADLRAALREAGTEYKVFKNTLARRAAQESGRTELLEMFEGPVAIAFVTGDAVPAAKALVQFGKRAPTLVVKGGLLGDRAITAENIRALSQVPPREVLLAMIAGAFQAPLVKTAGLLSGVQRKLAYAVQALVDQRIEGGEALPTESDGAPEPAADVEPSVEAADAPATEAEADAEAADVDAEIGAESESAESDAEAEGAEAKPEGADAEAAEAGSDD